MVQSVDPISLSMFSWLYIMLCYVIFSFLFRDFLSLMFSVSVTLLNFSSTRTELWRVVFVGIWFCGWHQTVLLLLINTILGHDKVPGCGCVTVEVRLEFHLDREIFWIYISGVYYIFKFEIIRLVTCRLN